MWLFLFAFTQNLTKRPIVIDRLKCRLESLIGKPYGFEYELKGQLFQLKAHSTVNTINKVEIIKDNRDLVDQRLNQKLTSEEIKQMKEAEDLSGTVG